MADDEVPMLPITSARTLALCKSLPLRPHDVFICSYPKSGTTWTQNILATLLLKAAHFDHVSTYAPFFEIDPHWQGDAFHEKFAPGAAATGRRMFNTHLRWEQMPKAPTPEDATARYIYLVRDGRDVVVSFYHHLSNQGGDAGGFEGTFEEFFSQWNAGQLPYGRWADHLRSWDRAVGDPRVLFVRYEDMKKDLRSSVLKMIDHCDIKVSEAELDQLMPCFSLAFMKDNLNKYQPISVEWKNEFQFVRKGEVGDHVELFTDAMQEAFDATVQGAFPSGTLPGWAT